jgi:hypothetical protein
VSRVAHGVSKLYNANHIMDCSNLTRRLKEDEKSAAVMGNMIVSRVNEALMRLVEYSFTIGKID